MRHLTLKYPASQDYASIGVLIYSTPLTLKNLVPHQKPQKIVVFFTTITK